MMYTIGHQISLPPIRADGLRYHAAGPIISALKHSGHIRAVAYPIDEVAVFEAAKLFLQSEGWLIAGESAHAVRATIDEASPPKKRRREVHPHEHQRARIPRHRSLSLRPQNRIAERWCIFPLNRKTALNPPQDTTLGMFGDVLPKPMTQAGSKPSINGLKTLTQNIVEQRRTKANVTEQARTTPNKS